MMSDEYPHHAREVQEKNLEKALSGLRKRNEGKNSGDGGARVTNSVMSHQGLKNKIALGISHSLCSRMYSIKLKAI